MEPILPDSQQAFSNRIAVLQARIAAAAARARRDPASITLVAVSKTFPAAVVRAAHAAGLVHFGENRIQEAVPKIQAVNLPDIHWHLIGHLQTNKANAAVGPFALIHSVDSTRLIAALQKRAAALGLAQSILLQLNVSGEASKSGAAPAELPALLDAIRASPNLTCRGLMTIPPFEGDPRPHFRALRERLATLQPSANVQPAHLSMGMSGDFEIAIEEGSTLIRVGSAIFGGRA